MKSYLNLMAEVLVEGAYKGPSRPGMPATQELTGPQFKHNLAEGFPILTTKKVSLHNVATELLWFLKGHTNIQYLLDRNVKIWNSDAYRYYCSLAREAGVSETQLLSRADFLDKIMEGHLTPPHQISNPDYQLGDLGFIYGRQWTNFGCPFQAGFDQIHHLLNNLRSRPDSRYHLVTAWDPTIFLKRPDLAALPACHTLFQVIMQGRRLDLIQTQRSADVFLGLPYNITSYALLMHILADLTQAEVGKLVINIGSAHIYTNHFPQCKLQLGREPVDLPTLKTSPEYKSLVAKYLNYEINSQSFFKSLEPDMFSLVGYKPQEAISAKLSVGV